MACNDHTLVGLLVNYIFNWLLRMRASSLLLLLRYRATTVVNFQIHVLPRQSRLLQDTNTTHYYC